MSRASSALLVGALLGAPAALQAQSATSTAPWQAGAGASYESYRFSSPEAVGIESLSLVSTPIAARVRLFGDASVSLSGGFATGAMRRADGKEISISGLTDTYLSVNVPVVRDFVTIRATAALPTGQPTLSLEQAELAGAFAADLLPFRVTSWGSGGAVGLSTTVVRTLGGFGVGLSAGYSAAREFAPLREDERAYRPGNELSFDLAVDRSVGRTGKASLQLAAQRFSTDQLGGQNLYQAGDRFSALGSYRFAMGHRSSGALYAGALHRTGGSFLDDTPDPAAKDLILAGAGMRTPLGRITLAPSVDARVFRSADGVGQGYLAGVGTAAEWRMGAAMLSASLRGRLGTVVAREGVETGFNGLEMGLTVRAGGAR